MMLPVIQNFANALVDVAVKSVEDKGKTISCKAGCGACCRQLVPISETEAQAIADARRTAAGTAPRRDSQSLRRRAAALATDRHARQTRASRKLERRGISCDRSRLFPSWHSVSVPRRGVVFDSSGAADHLPRISGHVAGGELRRRRPTSIDWVPLAGKVWTALARFDEAPPGSRYMRWVPLILRRSGPRSIPKSRRRGQARNGSNELFTKLTGREIRGTAPPVGTARRRRGALD